VHCHHVTHDFETNFPLIERYLAGECEPDEVARVERLFETSPGLENDVVALEAAVAAGAIDAAWIASVALGGLTNGRGEQTSLHVGRKVVRQVGWREALSVGTERYSGKHSLRTDGFLGKHTLPSGLASSPPWRRVGASAMAISATVAAFLMLRPTPPSRMHASTQVYRTGASQRSTVAFADGTRITLAPHTTLRISSQLSQDVRTVDVIGEAYFTVSQSAKIPLIVRAGPTHVRVLGTVFDVRRYPDESVTRVAVVNGKVSITTARATAIPLTAGFVATVTDSTVTTRATDLDSYVGWTSGRLRFADAPVSEVLSSVGRWYGYDLRLTDSVLAQRHLSVSFDQLSMTDVLEILGATLDVSMTMHGRAITLQPKRRAASPRPIRRMMLTDSLSQPTEVGR
jgi:ferric-dicitrate binding protein FerR (iron transport regulator)